jgi:hypothetical protein
LDCGAFFQNLVGEIGSESAKKVGSYLWNRWQRSRKRKKAEVTLAGLPIMDELDDQERKAILKIPNLIKSNDKKLREQLGKGIDLVDAVVALLVEDGWDQDLDVLRVIIQRTRAELSEIFIQFGSLMDMYRQLLSLTTDVRELRSRSKSIEKILDSVHHQIQEEGRRISSLSYIELQVPDVFSPLSGVLKEDVVRWNYLQALDSGRIEDLSEPQFFRRPRTSWIDLEVQAVVIRDAIINKIIENFRETNMQLLVGESGSGKSVIAYTLGYQYLRHGNIPVFYVDFIEQEPTVLSESLRRITQNLPRNKQRCLFIIDNVHANTDLIPDIFQNYRAGKSDMERELFHDIEFLFISRRDVRRSICQSPESEKMLNIVELKENDFDEVLGEITEKFLRFYQYDFDRDEITDSEIEAIKNKISGYCGNSLWLVSMYLDTILRKKAIPPDWDNLDIHEEIKKYYFSQDETYRIQGRRSVIEQVRSSILLSWSLRDSLSRTEFDKTVELLLLVSASICQLDVPIPIDFVSKIVKSHLDRQQQHLDEHDRVKSIRPLILSIGGVLDRLGELKMLLKFEQDHILFPHSLIAYELRRAFGQDYLKYDPDKQVETSSEKIIQLFKYYETSTHEHPTLLMNAILSTSHIDDLFPYIESHNHWIANYPFLLDRFLQYKLGADSVDKRHPPFHIVTPFFPVIDMKIMQNWGYFLLTPKAGIRAIVGTDFSMIDQTRRIERTKYYSIVIFCKSDDIEYIKDFLSKNPIDCNIFIQDIFDSFDTLYEWIGKQSTIQRYIRESSHALSHNQIPESVAILEQAVELMKSSLIVAMKSPQLYLESLHEVRDYLESLAGVIPTDTLEMVMNNLKKIEIAFERMKSLGLV